MKMLLVRRHFSHGFEPGDIVCDATTVTTLQVTGLSETWLSGLCLYTGRITSLAVSKALMVVKKEKRSWQSI